MQQEIERFRARTRWLHWVIVAAFLTLGITGLFLYVPQLGTVAQDGYTRLIHRIAAVIYIVSPILYFLISPMGSLKWLKEVFTWGANDLAWLEAAPDYYFGGSESRMPAQPAMNTGQKSYALTVVLGSIGFVITGLLMWFGRGSISPGAFLAIIIVHDILFIGVGSFMLVHFYLGVMHPRMTESLRSMIGGKVSVEYAKSHHGKWYEEVSRGRQAAKRKPVGEG